MHARSLVLLSAACLGFVCFDTEAALVSFASDTQPSQPTFFGDGAGLLDGPGVTNVVLLIDDDNGPLPALEIPAEFRVFTLLGAAVSTPIGGGFLHTHTISTGTAFGFFDAGGNPLLTATIAAGGVLTSIGGPNAWGGTATIQASDAAGAITYQWHGAENPAYGLFAGLSVGYDDAAFTLSNLRTFPSGPPGIPLSGGRPGGAWSAEGSFSGTMHFVPGPGTYAFVAPAMTVLTRRRRARR
ncbi:MAG TPA: hypothetical protein VD971_13335 [Phycisphaerales bacterium]|nr:hypothetical protein [Phycisphaerales bacterium]